jgi:hypothetical protein
MKTMTITDPEGAGGLTLDSGWDRALRERADNRPTSRQGSPPDDADAAPPPRSISLYALLRGIGAVLIVAAFVMILFQGWRDGDALTRGTLLLAQTLALTLAGFGSGHLLHEPRGARLFIALALAVAPVAFAFLGAVTYPHLAAEPVAPSGLVPSDWLLAGTAMEPQTALVFTAVALVLLVLAVRIDFLVMARRSSGVLTMLYLVANLALLVPSRAEAVIAPTLLVLALLLGIAVIRQQRRDATLTTTEGLFARLVLALPLLVMAGRSLWLYAPDQVFFTSLALLGYLGSRLALVGLAPRRRGSRLIETAAVLLAALTAWFAFRTLAGLHWVADPVSLPVAAGILGLLLADLSRIGSPRTEAYRSAAATAMAIAMMLDLVLHGGIALASVTLAVGIAVLAYGYMARRGTVFAAGILCAVFGLLVTVHTTMVSFSIAGWTILVLVGIATIIAGSALERCGFRARSAVEQWSRRFGRSAA